MVEEAWGRWGPDDERGALNLIGPEQVRRAASLVRTGQPVGLAQSISDSLQVPSHRHKVMHFMGRDGGDYAAGARRPGGFQFAEDTIVLPLHTGTHIDALCHAWYDDKLYNGFSGNSVRSTSGAAHCGIEKFPPIVTRGVLLDLVGLGGGPLEASEIVSRERVEAALKRAGVTPERGDAVLVRTGWLEAQKPGEQADFSREPGLDLGAALFLAEAGVAVVGADNFAVEVLPFAEGTIFPVHQRLIRDFGVPLIEGLELKALAEAGATSFLFIAAPLQVSGGTGSPINPVAVL